MRATIAIAALAATACTASATVKRQSAIANLQTYRVVKVRVDSSAEGRSWTRDLEADVVHKLATTCRFDRVVPNDQQTEAPPDLVVDLNIQRSYRGGTGIIQNANQAVMEVLLVLSDGATEDLLGSAWIRGESPTVFVSGSSPEGKALSAVADSVAKVLKMSGCELARLDPAPEPEPEPEPEPGPDGQTPVVDDSLARAEALNEEGKTLFRGADIEGAAAKFRAAVDLDPDARYAFNLCVAYDALKRYDDALAACQQALDGNPSERLRAKTEDRMTRIRGK